jgi:hypothetical protein
VNNTVVLNYEMAHAFVESNKNKNIFWDGWTIVKWAPGSNGYTQTNGMFRNGKWGYANRFPVSGNGTWRIPSKYVSS